MAQRAFFGLSFIPTLLLAIFPITCWICGIITCVQREQYFFTFLRVLFGWNIIWLIDVVSILAHKDLVWLA